MACNHNIKEESSLPYHLPFQYATSRLPESSNPNEIKTTGLSA
ncbi:hypothetical protein EIKCOROL_01969 [Eikenella corrodens ATCC 23834]|uniref:Uncharacterized protein n=1 Tax=Eikenella corrodens ATCC 23834 TaxID=546274 RepID=C0DX65_EIKCO|nr:hypothetical protein EIKCOROL_01969 [Eikenella corrodens ATCC 23834]